MGMGMEIAWSVGVEATGDRVVPTEQIVDLADAVAPRGGSASGIGTNSYGATFLVYAEDRETAIAKAKELFQIAARTAKMPEWGITRVEAESEEDVEIEPGFP
jgi:hypothetical protein